MPTNVLARDIKNTSVRPITQDFINIIEQNLMKWRILLRTNLVNSYKCATRARELQDKTGMPSSKSIPKTVQDKAKHKDL